MRRALAGLLLVATTTTSLSAQQFPPTTLPPAENKSSAVTTPSTPSPTAPAETAPPPLATRQTTFTIPFTVEAGKGTVEVQLHVSRDAGAKWDIYSRQRPEAGQFLFRASEDGEYWFASRLVDAQGRGALAAGETLTPELRVRVDTTPPKAELSARVGAGGEIIAKFAASDGDLVMESVKVEFQPAGDEKWQAVVLDPTLVKQSPGDIQGEVRWYPKTNQRAIGIRLVARDGASNTTLINRGIYLPGATKPGETPQRSPAPLDVDPFRRDDLTQRKPTAQPWPEESSGSPTTSTSANPPSATASKPDTTSPLPNYQAVSAPIAGAPVANQVEASRPPSTPPDFVPPSTIAPWPTGAAGNAPPNSAPTANPAEHPFPSTGISSSSEPPQPAGARTDLPSGEQPHFTTRKRFKLDYDRSDVPADQLADVELWGTHDGGRTWLKWGTDPDRESPFEVEVEREGVFGFRIVMVHRNGMAGITPRSGDAADIWIGVDGTQPTAKFGSIAYGKGLNAGQLDIQWTASDDWLSARPISLSYATAPEGPWTAVATGLANTGQFSWRVEPSVPRKVFLKLEVRDDAGNLTEDRTTEPLELEGLIPRGKIRGLAPL